MKEIKAYVHRNRIADVISALKDSTAWGTAAASGRHNLTVYMVQGSLLPLDAAETHYSLDLGDEVVKEYKIELFCEDEDAAELVEVIRTTARTGQPKAGWIYVNTPVSAIEISTP